MPGSPITRTQRILAAVWGGGPGAAASHRSSAWLWDVERPEDDPIDVILTSRTAKPALPGVVLHRPTDRIETRPIVRRGVPTTSPLRMLVDLGAVAPDDVYAAMEAIIIARVAAPRAVTAALARHAGKGRAGIGALREALDRYPFALEVADSVLEGLMAELVVGYGLPPVEFHPRVGRFEPDFRVIGTCVLLECDGRKAHDLDDERFDHDRARLQELTGLGWIVVPFTWQQITRHPAGVARRIREVLVTWAPHVLVA